MLLQESYHIPTYMGFDKKMEDARYKGVLARHTRADKRIFSLDAAS
jgi:hypothetical protein